MMGLNNGSRFFTGAIAALLVNWQLNFNDWAAEYLPGLFCFLCFCHICLFFFWVPAAADFNEIQVQL